MLFPCCISEFLLSLLSYIYQSIFTNKLADTPRQELTGSPQPAKMSKAEDKKIWFDGVNKKLLEMNSIQPKLVNGTNDKDLLTKTPLASYSSYAIKKKNDMKQKARAAESSEKIANGQPFRGHDAKMKQKLKAIKSKSDTVKPNTGVTDELALDCEMVECYHHKSVLARISIVNLFGHPILDRYVAPPSRVTDYRTKYSGIRKKDLDNAPSFETVQKEVANLIKGRIVVGHAIHNDFSVLKLLHPPEHTRDTSQYFKYLFQGKTPSLKKLSESILGVKIQKGEHDSIQDAQATMKLYVKERDKWNQTLHHNRYHNPEQNRAKKQKNKPAKKKMKTFYVNTT